MIPLFFAAVAALSVAIAAGYEGYGRYFEAGGVVPGSSVPHLDPFVGFSEKEIAELHQRWLDLYRSQRPPHGCIILPPGESITITSERD